MENEPLKILTLSTSDSNGGAARATYRIFEGVRSLGVSDRMLVKEKGTSDEAVVELRKYEPQKFFYPLYDWLKNKVKNKIQHRRWGRYSNRKPIFLSDLRSVPMHGALQKMDYDVLHLHWCNLRFLPFQELRKVRKPIVWTLHDTWAFTGICHYFEDCPKYQTECGACPLLASNDANDLSRAVFRKKREYYKGLDLHIVTPSRWLADCVKKSALLGKIPVSVIPNCIDVDAFSPGDRDEACRHFDLPTDRRYILYGAMGATSDPRKGFAELITAMGMMEEDASLSDVELVVFGSDRPLQALTLRRKIHYLGLLSREEDIVAAYRLSSVMVVPSLSENLSNSIMEALSCGIPVAAFDIGGNGDMIRHRENGYLAKEKDCQDLADGIRYLLQNPDKESFATNARRWVMEHYTVSNVAKQYVELYKKVKEDSK